VAKENEASNPGTSSALNHIIKTMGSLANMSKVGPVSGGPGMGHVHGPHCQHGHDQGHAGHGGHDAGEYECVYGFVGARRAALYCVGTALSGGIVAMSVLDDKRSPK
jgi:hypothetical protein